MSRFAVQDMTQSDIILGLYPKEDPKFCLDFADGRLDNSSGNVDLGTLVVDDPDSGKWIPVLAADVIAGTAPKGVIGVVFTTGAANYAIKGEIGTSDSESGNILMAGQVKFKLQFVELAVAGAATKAQIKAYVEKYYGAGGRSAYLVDGDPKFDGTYDDVTI